MMQDGTESHDGFGTLLLEKIDGIARKVEQTGDSVGKLVTDVAVLTERGNVDRDDIKALKGKTDYLYVKIAGMAGSIGVFSAFVIEWVKGLLPHK